MSFSPGHQSFFLEAENLAGAAADDDVIQTADVQKFAGSDEAFCDLQVFFTGGNVSARVVVQLCIVFSYEKSAPELLKNQCVQ